MGFFIALIIIALFIWSGAWVNLLRGCFTLFVLFFILGIVCSIISFMFTGHL